MRSTDQESLEKFLDEIRVESDRGLALIGAAFIDEKLAATLQAFFCKDADDFLHGKNAPLGNFSARIEACYLLGLIDDIEWNDCNQIRKIRNEFAHKVLTASFKERKISDLCKNLRAEMPEPEMLGKASARFRFQNSIVGMATRLFYRAEYVTQEKRISKVWVDAETMRWRRISEEPPPEGAPVILFGSGFVSKRGK